MTPDYIVTKYKNKIIGFLPKEDAEVIEAYVNAEVDRRVKRREFNSKIITQCLEALPIGICIAVVLTPFFIFGMMIYDGNAYARGIEDAISEEGYQKNLQKEIQEYQNIIKSEIFSMTEEIAILKTQVRNCKTGG